MIRRVYVQVASDALRRRGIVGLYAGFHSSMFGAMLGTGLGFCAYEASQRAFASAAERKPSALEKGVIGAASAVVVMTGTMPLELIQRRMQA
jgi:Mitochondrial carrier protein